MKRKEIFIRRRTLERITVRTNGNSSDQFGDCVRCRHTVRWVPMHGLLASPDPRYANLAERVAAGKVHLRFLSDESIMICEDSLVGSAPESE